MIAAYSPEAKRRSKRAFGAHQGGLLPVLLKAGMTDIKAVNRYLGETYLPVFNEEFSIKAREDGEAFVLSLIAMWMISYVSILSGV